MYYTMKEVMEIVGETTGRKIGRTKCYELLKYGQIKSIKKDKYYYVKKEWLEEYLCEQLDENKVCIKKENNVQCNCLKRFSGIEQKQIQEEKNGQQSTTCEYCRQYNQ